MICAPRLFQAAETHGRDGCACGCGLVVVFNSTAHVDLGCWRGAVFRVGAGRVQDFVDDAWARVAIGSGLPCAVMFADAREGHAVAAALEAGRRRRMH